MGSITKGTGSRIALNRASQQDVDLSLELLTKRVPNAETSAKNYSYLLYSDALET